MIRVVVQHEPNLFAILGLAEETDCPREMAQPAGTYYRVQTTSRWVLYKRAITGWGETKTLDPRQR